MDLGLEGKVALVTASSQGLGQAIAMEFAKEGAKVAICARRKQPLEEAREHIAALGAEVLDVTADMSQPEAPGGVSNRLAIGTNSNPAKRSSTFL